MLTESEVNDALERLGWGDELLFSSKESRDQVYRVAKKHVKLKRGSTGHQLLDPRYTFEGRHKPDMGLMNDYRHSFGNLYTLKKVS